jgi:glycosyltransferase involved in cell wall biosynthesis
VRLLLVSHGYPPTFGGVETYLWDLSHELAERGHEVVCLVGGETASEYFGPVRVERRPELTVAWLTALHAGESGWRRRADAHDRLAALINDVLVGFPADVVHIQNGHHFAPELAEALFTSTSSPVMNGVHDHIGNSVYPETLSWPWAFTLFASKYLRANLPAPHGPAKVLNLGIDLRHFQADGPRDPRLTSLERPVIFHPARLLRWKGVHVGVAAFLRVHRELGRGSLVLCDARRVVDDQAEIGRYRSELIDMARSAGLESAIHFLDISRAQIADAYRASDLVWYPTIDQEPYGLVPLEAMACGVPLVVSRSGGMQETVVDGVTGIAVDCGDVEGLAEAAIHLLRDSSYAARFVERAGEHVRAYDVHRHVEDVEAVYEEVL